MKCCGKLRIMLSSTRYTSSLAVVTQLVILSRSLYSPRWWLDIRGIGQYTTVTIKNLIIALHLRSIDCPPTLVDCLPHENEHGHDAVAIVGLDGCIQQGSLVAH